MRNLKIGEDVFYAGKVYRLTGTYGGTAYVLYDIESSPITAITAPKHKVEALATNAFKIDQRVRRINGSFVGRVTGFEPTSNRVICVSDRCDYRNGDRTRYAYLVTELEAAPLVPVFKVNRIASIRLEGEREFKQVRPVHHPFEDHLLVLYRVDNGKSVGVVPMDTTAEDFSVLGIMEVK